MNKERRGKEGLSLQRPRQHGNGKAHKFLAQDAFSNYQNYIITKSIIFIIECLLN
jgi:hypothetical protein